MNTVRVTANRKGRREGQRRRTQKKNRAEEKNESGGERRRGKEGRHVVLVLRMR